MTTLVEFLRARLDEDERTARAVDPKAWTADSAWLTDMLDPLPSQRHGRPGWIPMVTAEDIRHIARHDPARVLAEVDAKRRIIDDCARTMSDDGAGPGEYGLALAVLLDLAAPHDGHPDYRQEWKP